MAQRTLLEGLQIPIANAAAEFSRVVLQTTRGRTGHSIFDDRRPQPSDVHSGGSRAITHGTVSCTAEAGARQLVFVGQIKNDRLPLDTYTPKITAPALPPGLGRALRRCALRSSEHPLLKITARVKAGT